MLLHRLPSPGFGRYCIRQVLDHEITDPLTCKPATSRDKSWRYDFVHLNAKNDRAGALKHD
jgi:hypothetical protein